MNMRNRLKISIPLTALAVILVSLSPPLQAAIEPAGNVILTSGPFVAIQSDRSARSLARGSEFYQGDRLWTGPRTRAQIRFSDGAIMTLRPDTEFSVDEYEFDDKDTSRNTSLFTLIKGGFRTITGLIAKLRPDNYKVKTSYAIVGVRGTTIEAVIQGGAFYVGVWQGTVSINTNKDEILLGFGQDFNYARVTSINSAPKGLVQTPPQFQLNIDPDLQEGVVDPTQTRLVTGLLEDGVDPRLTETEAASLTQLGFATVVGSQGTLSGAASDGSTGSPIFFLTGAGAGAGAGAGDVLRQGGPLSTGVSPNPNTPGFAPTITWGAWDGGLLQPDPTDPGVAASIASQVFWITMQPATNLPTGTVNYGPGGFGGVGTDSTVGAVNVVSFFAAVDFGTGDVNGTMAVQGGPKTWAMNFADTMSGSTFSANANGTITGGISAEGNLRGGFSGAAAQSMGGAFKFNEVGNPNNVVNGVFAASQ